MFYQHDDITDVQLGNPISQAVNNLLEGEQENITAEAMITFWLDDETRINDVRLTLTKWYKKRYKIFLLHFGSPINEIIIENNKVEYFIDMGLGGSGFNYKQVLGDFFFYIEEAHGSIIDCDILFL